jgi:hypothetical protein
MGFALFFNIIAVIISTVASIILIIIIAAVNEFVGDYETNCIDVNDKCTCFYNRNDRTNYVTCK